MLVAFLVLAFGGGVLLESPGKYFMQTKGGPEAPHLSSKSSMSQTSGRQPLDFCLQWARLRRGGAELAAERDGVEDGLFSPRGTDLEVGALDRVTKREPSATMPLQVLRAELLTCNPGNADQPSSSSPRSLGSISVLTDWFYLPFWLRCSRANWA